MNKFKYIMIGLIAFIGVHCSDDYQAPTKFSYGDLVTNIVDNVTNVYDVQVFQDLSQGVVSRVWDFGTDFKYVKGDATSERVEGLFTTAGDHKVTLKAKFINENYLIDTTFVINVKALIRANFTATIVDDPLAKTYDTLTPITIEAGSAVKFTSTSIGEPKKYVWSLPGSDRILNSGDDLVAVTANYYLAGVYDVIFVGSRIRPWGLDTIVVKNYITVTQSTKPVIIKTIKQTANDKLELAFSGAMKAPVKADISAFTVMRNKVPVAVKSLEAKTDDITKFIMEIDGGAWNGDEISVTYKNGTIESLTGIKLIEFEDFKFEPYIVNLAVNGNFELESPRPIIYGGDGGDWAVSKESTCNISSVKAYSGVKSCYINTNASSKRLLRSVEAADFALEKNKVYMFEYWYYPLTTNCWFVAFLESRNDWLNSHKDEGTWFDKSADTEWHKSSFTFTGKENDDRTFWYIQYDSNFEAYIDDVKIYEYKKHE